MESGIEREREGERENYWERILAALPGIHTHMPIRKKSLTQIQTDTNITLSSGPPGLLASTYNICLLRLYIESTLVPAYRSHVFPRALY